jgi:hypothetical protein
MKKRLWDDSEGDDPAAGLINLFDVWIAFAAALLLAVVSFFNLPKTAPTASTDAPKLSDSWKAKPARAAKANASAPPIVSNPARSSTSATKRSELPLKHSGKKNGKELDGSSPLKLARRSASVYMSSRMRCTSSRDLPRRFCRRP